MVNIIRVPIMIYLRGPNSTKTLSRITIISVPTTAPSALPIPPIVIIAKPKITVSNANKLKATPL